MKCLCCSTEYSSEKDKKGFTACPVCGVFFNANTFSKVQSRKSILEGNDLKLALKNNVHKFHPVLDRIEKYLHLNIKDRVNRNSLFDVCCGIGGSLRCALDRSWNSVLGCDLNTGHCEIAKKYYGVTVLNSEVEDITGLKDRYSCVMSFHGIEHVRFPFIALRKMLDMSKGIVYLEHPCTYTEEERNKNGHVHEWSYESFSYLVDLLGCEAIGERFGSNQRWILFP